MANRRMISKSIFHDDRFTDLPLSTRLLYCYLILEADDDGFITSKKSAIMFAGAEESDFQNLIENGYIIKLPSGVCVIRHWLQMNKVQESRKTPTIYLDELSQLKTEKDGTYIPCQQNDDKPSTQYSISQYQDSTSKDNTSKDNTSKGDEADGISTFLKDENYKAALNHYREKIGNFRSVAEYQKFNELLKLYDFDYVLPGIDFMATKEGKSVNYLERVLATNNFERF